MKNNIYGDSRAERDITNTIQTQRIPEYDSQKLYEKIVEEKNQ